MATSDIPVIFIACANSHKAGKILPSLEKERKEIRQQFNFPASRKLCELITEGHTDTEHFYDILKNSDYKKRIQILHFAGHADDSFLRFISVKGKEQKRSVQELCEDVKGLSGLKLIFLNGCATKNFVEGLLQTGVPAVLATSKKIEDSRALIFARSFYEGLIGNQSMEDAFGRAKNRLTEKPSNEDEKPLLNKKLIDIHEVSVQDGKVSIPENVFFRAPEEEDEEQEETGEKSKEFAWNLYYTPEIQGKKNTVREWVFLPSSAMVSVTEVEKKLIEQQALLQTDIEALEKQKKEEEENKAKREKFKKRQEENEPLDDFDKWEKWDENISKIKKAIEEIEGKIKKIEAQIAEKIKQLNQLSGLATQEVLKQGLLGLNFTKQTTTYTSKKGDLLDNYLNLILVRGPKDHGIDMLRKVILNKLSLVSKPPSKSLVLNFAGDIYEPDKDNIWNLTGEALASEHGKINKSPSSKTYPPVEVCKNLAKLLETGPVIIRWEDILEEMIAEDFIEIVNAFWKELITQFPKEPPKHRLFVFLIDRMGSQTLAVNEIYSETKYVENRKSFFSLPPIEPVSRTEMVQWYNQLKDKPDFKASELPKISSKYDFFVTEDKPQPIEPVIYDICEAFNFSDLAKNLLT